MGNKHDRNVLIYQPSNKKKSKPFDIQKFKTIRFSETEIHTNDLQLNEVLKQQILKDDIDSFKESTKPK